MSQQTLASKAGVAIRTLIRIEQGEDTKVGTLTLVAAALDMPVADLVAPLAAALVPPAPSSEVQDQEQDA